MTRATPLLRSARDAGLTLRRDGNRLVIRGPSSVGALARQLLSAKAAVLAALDAEAAAGPALPPLPAPPPRPVVGGGGPDRRPGRRRLMPSLPPPGPRSAHGRVELVPALRGAGGVAVTRAVALRGDPGPDPARVLAVLHRLRALGVGLRPGPAPDAVTLDGTVAPTLAAEVAAAAPVLRQLVDAEAALAARCAALVRLPHPRPPIPGPSWQGYLPELAAGCAATDPPSWPAGVGAYCAAVSAELDRVERAARSETR